MRGRKAEAAAAIHPLGLGATPVHSRAQARQREPTTHHLTTLPSDEQTLHHHRPSPTSPPPPSTSHCIIACCIADLTRLFSSSPPATRLRLRLRAAAVAFSEPHDEAARTSRDTALCLLDPPGTRHAKHSRHPIPAPGLTPIGSSQYCVFFCKQATASPEALTRTALADCCIRPRHHQLRKHTTHPIEPHILASATRS